MKLLNSFNTQYFQISQQELLSLIMGTSQVQGQNARPNKLTTVEHYVGTDFQYLTFTNAQAI